MTQEQALEVLKLGCNVFLTGPPGSGKTFLLNKYINYLRRHRKAVAVTASTGIAATHMNGTTIHSWSGLGIKNSLSDADVRKLLQRSYLRKRFKETGVLIIDEISMLKAAQFDMVDIICQAFKGDPKPFGSMQVICAGDLFQLPPIERQGQPAAFVVKADVWPKMNIKVCYLEEQHRHKNDDLFSLLNFIRRNAVNKSRNLLLARQKPKKVFLIAPTKLYTHNIDVDAINNFELSKIKEKAFVYRMESRGRKNIVVSLMKSCLAPQELWLKKGAQVMFVKNNYERGYINGTRGRVIDFGKDRLPIVETFSGQKITATPANWAIEEDGIIKAEINQIPLRLAWAITVHKSQGMNLDTAEIDLSKCFVEGMGYVALSRLRSLDGLRLKGINELAFRVNAQALKFDQEFKEMSQRVVKGLSQMTFEQKKRIQTKFLYSLACVKLKKKSKEDLISTYDKTRALVLRKMPLVKIAKKRGLTQDTIISHLEKLVADKEKINLDFLRLPQERFEKIKMAFQQTGAWHLSPVREILGDDFSYQELKLARLFLVNSGIRDP